MMDRLSATRLRIQQLETELASARQELRELERGAEHPICQPAESAAPSRRAAAHSVTQRSSPAEKLALFRSRFAGRDDVYALPWVSRRTGKKGWSPVVRGGFYTDAATDHDLLPVTDAVIERHLRGSIDHGREFHVGLYPLLAGDRTRLLACDFDDGDWRDDAGAYFAACYRAGIDALAEISRSGEGAHIWIFFDTAVLAAAARAMGAKLLRSAMSDRATISMSSYDRFFPAQDTLPQRSTGRARLGNLIALPLQGACRRAGTTVFADPSTWEPFVDQFSALGSVTPVAAERLAEFATPARPPAGPRESFVVRPSKSAIASVAKVAAGRCVSVRRDAMVHVPTDGIPGIVVSALKHAASVSNPEFYRKQAQRLSTFGTPRLVTCFERDDTELRLPRGLLDEVRAVLSDAGFVVDLRQDSNARAPINARFTGTLRPEQDGAVRELLRHDTGVLVAPPGSGKTVVACALIAARAEPTAILVNRAELLQQWRARLTQFLSIVDGQIGQLGNGRRKRRGIIDLIMMQSVAHRKGDPRVLEEYGQIIVDECHAIAAPAIEAAIRTVDVPYWVGLTATPYRADQMDGLITMQCGPIRHVIAAAMRAERRAVVHQTTFTTTETGADGPSIQAIYTELATDELRNALIVNSVLGAVREGRRCLVLTNRLDHLDVLVAALSAATTVPVLAMHGRQAPAERRATRERVAELDGSRKPYVLVAIDKVAGEGVDLPSLNTLFLAVPVSFKGRVIQQIGRVTRGDEDGEAVATVHDFRDSAVPMLERMHQRRRRVMNKEGFTVVDGE